MFRRERCIPLRGSAAALSNNLSVLQLPARNLTHFGVVHGPCAQLLSAAPEGVPLAQRQLQVKEGAGVSPPLITQVRQGVKEMLLKSVRSLFFNPYPLDTLCPCLLQCTSLQVHWCVLPFRVLLVLTSHRGIQVRGEPSYLFSSAPTPITLSNFSREQPTLTLFFIFMPFILPFFFFTL